MLGDFPRPVTAAAARTARLGGVLRYWAKRGGSSVVVGLSRAEVTDLLGGGVALGTIYEDVSAAWMSGGYPAGQQAAQWLQKQFAATGHTPRCVYFAADSNTLSSSAVNSCLDGAANILGRQMVGLYAYAPQLTSARSGGHAAWYWLTGHYAPLPWMHLYQCNGSQPAQYSTQVSVAGQVGDGDIALQQDWGQTGEAGMSTAWSDQFPVPALDGTGTYIGDAKNADGTVKSASVEDNIRFTNAAIWWVVAKVGALAAQVADIATAVRATDADVQAGAQAVDKDVQAALQQLLAAIKAEGTAQVSPAALQAALTAANVPQGIISAIAAAFAKAGGGS